MGKELVIIGSGMAGGKLVEEILALNPGAWHIIIIGDEPEGNYNRIKINYLLGEEEPEEFWLNPPSWYIQHGIDAILGHRVLKIDPGTHQVELDDGRTIHYDHLVLATGSRPFLPTIQNGHLPVVRSIRSVADARAVRPLIRDGLRVIVIGGGLLGLELALILKDLSARVTVSQFMPWLMETQLDEEGGRTTQALLEAEGLAFIMNTYMTEIHPLDPKKPEGSFKAVFKNGREMEADLVLVSAGIKPNIDLARDAGLVCHKGVAVNKHLECSDPTISAVGECIEFEGKVWGLVAPAYDQARVVAARLCGNTEACYAPGLPGLTRLKSTIPVISMGQFCLAPPPSGINATAHAGGPEDLEVKTVVYHDPGRVYKKLLVKNRKLVGAVLVGDDLNADTIALHYSAGLPLPERTSDLLFPGAGAGEHLPDPSLWPDDLTVCDCNGVHAGKIRTAIANGADTLNKVMNQTKAGTGCGNCKGKIRALLISEVGELKDDPSERWYVPGIPLERPALEAFVLERNLHSVSAVLEAWPGAGDDIKTRHGLDFLLNFLYCGSYATEDDSRTANDRYSGNIQKDGRFSVIPDIPAGLTKPEHLRAIADAAEKFNAVIKVTGADRIGLYAVDKKDLPAVWDTLQMGSGHAFTKTFRSCKACVGSTYCRYGLGDSLALGERMASRYRGVMGPAKFKMGVSGCPRNCSEATIKDFGVVAAEQGWDIYIGGNGGAAVVAARHLTRVATDDEVIVLADRFYEYYRRHGRFGERSAPFLERVGFEVVSKAILAESAQAPEGAEGLEESFTRTLAAYKDPWKEGRRPLGDFDPEALSVVPALAEPSSKPAPGSIASLVGPIPRGAEWPPKASQKPAEGTNAATKPANTALSTAKPDFGPWKALVRAEAVPAGSSRVVFAGRKKLAVFHGRDGTWLVCENECPHERGPLNDGIYGHGKLTCTIHQYSFDTKSGACTQPNVGPLTIYRHEIKDGWVTALI